jgi:hypothetical protein
MRCIVFKNCRKCKFTGAALAVNVPPDRVGVRQLEEEEAGVAPELGHLHPQPALTLLPLVSQEAVAIVVPVIHLGNNFKQYFQPVPLVFVNLINIGNSTSVS